MAIWVRKCALFEEERRADREFWAAFTPDERVALVETLRQDWARISEQPIERLRRTVRVFLRNKRAASRPQDLADIDVLEGGVDDVT